MTHNPSHFRLNPNIMPQFQIKIDVSKTKNLTKEKNIYKIQVGEKNNKIME